ncbi:proteinaceous RNase P 1 chloroplastic/mitochondrial isoform X1 [Prunus yedoensis var. nudiflora]|uniref:ribonuclease P n=1 Tax=Prunus yedoensis var. nudiflora TaxID=2094558 RepID=A0A314XT21_PRUYE|nr:proteinaceous RNase P 1 chloroplastic/mitochondrial isoform X1 [Prunus yedoensis var. nudiflora]
MASSTSNSLQQKHHLLSINLCKYPSALNSFKFHCPSHFLTFSPPKQTLELKHTLQLYPLPVVRENISHIVAKLSTTYREPYIKTKTSGAGTEFSSLKSTEERVGKKSVKNDVGSVEEKKAEDRFSKDRNTRKNPGFRKRRDDNGHSSRRLKDENKVNSSGKRNDKQAGEEKRGKGSKKYDVDAPEVKMRVGLDMCSKRGDVMGAIKFYDLAQREEIKLEQYHYTVLLYLCSSAAVGVVRPAKSGSGSRTLDTLDSSASEETRVNSMELGSGNWDGRGLNTSTLDNDQLVDTNGSNGDKMGFDDLDGTSDEKENLAWFSNGFVKRNSRLLDGLNYPTKGGEDSSNLKDGSIKQEDNGIRVSEEVKKYALQRGFEIYEKMCLDNVPMNEAALTSVARMAMSMGDGDMAFDMVKQMKSLGINPRLRSYGPALSAFCHSGDIDKAFAVEKHMLEHGVYPEEPELEALLRVSVGVGKGDKVYYMLHKLRTSVRRVSPSTADLIMNWFHSKEAARVGKIKWDPRLIRDAIENGGGGWHGQGWLGKGKWSVLRTTIGADGLCKCCGEKLATIDLDPVETENFAESVASIAIKREKNSSFQKFQKWLDYYGPFEAVVDGANVGLFSQKKFIPSKVNAVVNGIRQKLPSKRWPLIVLHNRRISGGKMDERVNRALIEKWQNADALYATPTGSNDDWYWLYAAIKFKCLLVTNDEMRDHIFQLLGNDFFPRWKERHQVHFSFSDAGPVFHMPPPCSVVIQESEEGHWHIPVASEHDCEAERTWLCIMRSKSRLERNDSATRPEVAQPLRHDNGNARSATQTGVESQPLKNGKQKYTKHQPHEFFENLKDILSGSMISYCQSIVPDIATAEKIGGCVIDFQI